MLGPQMVKATAPAVAPLAESITRCSSRRMFYTVDQHEQEKPRFARQADSCLICYSSSRTDGVPGLEIIRQTNDCLPEYWNAVEDEA